MVEHSPNTVASKEKVTNKARFFQIRKIITLLQVNFEILGFMTFTLLQGHSCVRNINCNIQLVNNT